VKLKIATEFAPAGAVHRTAVPAGVDGSCGTSVYYQHEGEPSRSFALGP
jgi:hypothetical protein